MSPSVEHHWQTRTLLSNLLAPLGALYCGVAALRRLAYQRRWLQVQTLPVPVVVVGNLTVGGTGKTPLVIWLCELLRRDGYRPGVVSRGYGGKSGAWPLDVTAATDSVEAGDEPVLIAEATGCPVVAGPDRVAAARALIAKHRVNIIVSDDGLQHYRLGRDIEICVVDGERRFGNGRCLPAGPLREPVARLKRADFIVTNGKAQPDEYSMRMVVRSLRQLASGECKPAGEFPREAPIHAVAGTGNPARFFALLREQGLRVEEHAFPDHHHFRPGDLEFPGDAPIVMTAKDAVKCRAFATSRHWALEVSAEPAPEFAKRLLHLIEEKPRG
jgi:tetraacyldisaccharide 4'-kinase